MSSMKNQNMEKIATISISMKWKHKKDAKDNLEKC